MDHMQFNQGTAMFAGAARIKNRAEEFAKDFCQPEKASAYLDAIMAAGYRSGLKDGALPDGLISDGKKAEATFLARMLMSCLSDADCLSAEDRLPCRNNNMTELEWALNEYMSMWFPPHTEINRQRCAILECCRQEGPIRKPGLFTLTAPTGSGKTTASLAFALAHARANHMNRIIYVAPYTSVVEQTAQIFRDILGDNKVLEFQNGSHYDAQEQTPSPMTQSAENWDVPVIVTTAVQLFQSLYSNKPSQCRKLHNLANSVLIFDEAQMMPLCYMRPCAFALTQLVQHFGASAVLCTASRSMMGNLIHEFMPNATPVELCPSSVYRPELFHRCTLQRVGTLSWSDLASRINRRSQVLCVVNSRKSALEVFKRMRGEGCYHLSTLMYPRHRQAVMAEIRRRLRSNQPCRVVSTSLVEGGVDLDFPTVFREESGLDSIMLAAGRCNRNGYRAVEDSIVTVFQSPEPCHPFFEDAIEAQREAMKQTFDLADPRTMDLYYQEMLNRCDQDTLDSKSLIKIMEEQSFPFQTLTENFHLFTFPPRYVYIPLGEGMNLMTRHRSGERSLELFRQMSRYSVCIHADYFNELAEQGVLEVLEDGSAFLMHLGLYDQASGLVPSPSIP